MTKCLFLCNYFTASLSALPALNAGTFEAAISISSPVSGYDLYELRVRELQSYQNRLIELFAFRKEALIAENTASTAAAESF